MNHTSLKPKYNLFIQKHQMDSSPDHSPSQNLRNFSRLRLPGCLQKDFHIPDISDAFKNRDTLHLVKYR